MPSRLALKLCRDFVESSFNLTSMYNSKTKSNADVSRKQNTTDELKKSFPIRTQKITSKKIPSTSSNIRDLKSKGNISNSDIANRGINTLISGQLRCDNNCVTKVRRRDHPPTCKCAQTQNIKNKRTEEKDIQTKHKICKDKAACCSGSRSFVCVNDVLRNRNKNYTTSDQSSTNIKNKEIYVSVESSFNSSSMDNSKTKPNANVSRKQKSTDELKKSFPIRTQNITSKKIPSTICSNIRDLKSKGNISNSDIANKGINTLISGPLRCDNNCVTMVRRQDHPPTCKCAQKQNIKNKRTEEKDIQTKHMICKDKAACCSGSRSYVCVNDVLGNKNYTSDQSSINIKKKKRFVSNKPSNNFNRPKLIEMSPLLNQTITTCDKVSSCHETSEKFQGNFKLCNIRNVSAQRWSITNYPIRGPDF